MTARMKLIRYYVPFDALTRSQKDDLVRGHAFVNEVVEGEGGIALKRHAMEEATEEFRRWGNVREMHGKTAAGVIKEDAWDDVGWMVGADIVDPLAREKVKRGVYKGFSVGVQPLMMRGKDVMKCKIVEVSLVDRPKDPDAVFTAYRAEGFDPGLAYDVELLPASDGAIEGIERRAPGSSVLDSPEAISAGSTYYGEDPEKIGICGIVKENDHYCVYGPDGQKLGEFPTHEEARKRAMEITDALKNEIDLDDHDGKNPNLLGGPGQDQNAGPMIKLPDVAAGEEKRAVVLQEGDPLQLGFDTGTKKFQLYRDGLSQLLGEWDTAEERAAFIKAAIARGKTGVEREITSAEAPSRENLEGGKPKKKVERDKDEDDEEETDDAEEGDEDDPEKKRKKALKAQEDAVKEKQKRAKDRDKAHEEMKDDADSEEKRAITPADLRRLADELEARERAMTAANGSLDPMMGLPTLPKEQAAEKEFGNRAYPEENVTYADDANMRFPLDTEANIRAAWEQVTHADSIKTHSTTEIAAMKSRIKAAAMARGFALEDPAKDAYRAAGIEREDKKDEQHGHDSPPKGYPESKGEYADPKNYKYPIDTEAHVRAAWSYINKAKNAGMYSAGELAAIKGRIKAAAKKHGIEISGEDEERALQAEFERVIVNEDSRWVLYDHTGKKKLGTFETKEEAQAREREIDYFKSGKRDGEKDRMDGEPTKHDGSPDEHPLAASHRMEEAEEFFCRLARLEDENLILTERLAQAESSTARAQEAEEEAKRLLASAEAQVERLAAMPAPLSRINTPVLFPEALPRTFLANRRDGASQTTKELEERIAALAALPPTVDAGEQNRRAQEMMIIKAQLHEVFRE